MEYKNIQITALDHYGYGITKIDNKITFVENALIDENVDIKIIKENKKYNKAIVTKYNSKSKNRREVLCPYYSNCGGCNIMHMKYENQIEFKKDKVINILKKYADIELNPKIIKSNEEYNYRNKVTFHIKNKKLGFYKKDTNDIIDIDKCLIINNILNDNKKIIKDKELIMRCNEKNEIITNENNSNIIKKINNLKFKVNINSFFQVNDYICSKLFNIIEENINNNSKVLDLYSGVGTLGIISSKKANKVISVELNKDSFNNIKDNIKLNDIKNIDVINDKVENFIEQYSDACDTIIIDPPRSGVKNNIIEFINQNKIKQIIYISCNPMTLARDIKLLNNYKITKSYMLDMFPNTYHVECVCVLDYC